MPVITTYRTTETLATQAGQMLIGSKLTELFTDCIETFGIEIIEIQTIAGRLYIHLSDTLNRADYPPEYYNLEKASM